MPNDSKLQPLFLLSDEPIRSRAEDRLGQARCASLIAEAALGTTGPFTIGVYAGWGQGKTSLLKFAKDLLDAREGDDPATGVRGTGPRLHAEVATVFFNAWRYEREAHPIVPLVATIAREVEKRIREDASLPQATGAAIKRWWGKIVDAGAAAVAATKIDMKGRLGNPVVGQIEGGGVVDGGAGQKAYAEKQAMRKTDEAPRIQSWIDQSLYLSAFDDLESLWDEEIVKVATPTCPAPRLVVFIDDLDRCQPEKAFELLEGVKLALAQPGFIFVLALNADIIHRYLAMEADKRYGPGHTKLGDRYLDKIVQLEIPVRSHKTHFDGFIDETVNKSLAGILGGADAAVPRELAEVFTSLRGLLGRFTGHTPRTLIRRINSLIVDERLLPDDAPFEAKKPNEREMAHTSRRRSYYLGLILVQRTLVETPGIGSEAVRRLHDEAELCERIGREGFDTVFDSLKPREGDEKSPADQQNPATTVAAPAKRERPIAIRWLTIMSPFRGHDDLVDLWQTEPGRAWLTDRVARKAVVDLVAERTELPADSNSPTLLTRTGLSDALRALPRFLSNDEVAALEREIALIDKAIRKGLHLKRNAPVTSLDRAAVVELSLSDEPITDLGVAWLARSDSDFKALRSLSLARSKLTDSGLKELTSAGTSLKALTSLDLSYTQVGDPGAGALAAKDSGLKSLTSLHLCGTQVGDAGAAAMAAKDTSLKGLTALDLSHSKIGNAGVAALAAKDSGLTALIKLHLTGARIGYGATVALAASDSGLKNLTLLDLAATLIGDPGTEALAAKDTSLKVLTSLNLGYCPVGTAGAAFLAAKNSGLKALKELYLTGTQVGDSGAAALAAKDTALTSLTMLVLNNTHVGDAGATALTARDSGLKSLAELWLMGSKVTRGCIASIRKTSTIRLMFD